MAAKSASISGLTIKIGAETQQFAKAFRELDAEAKAIAKDLDTVNKNLKLDPTNSTKTAQSLNLLKESAQKASEKVKLIKDAIDKLNKEYASGVISAEDYNKSLSHLKQMLNQAQHEQDLANEKIKQFGHESDNAGNKADSLSEKIKGFLTSAVKKGFEGLVSLAKSLANHLWEAAKALGEYSWEAIQSAATFQDQMGYSETVFGDQADSVKRWAKENSLALRISEQDLLTYENRLGQIFLTQGISTEDSAKMAQNLLGLAADIRAATGKSMDEILPTMERGFTTSVKNFRQFGVIMTDAQVKMYAVEHGMVDMTVDATKLAVATANLHKAEQDYQTALAKYPEESVEVEKAEAALLVASQNYEEALEGEVGTLDSATLVMARYKLLNESLANIQGQNVKEQGLFNSQWELTKTIFTNLKDTIGLELLPVVTDLITKFNEFLQSEEGQALLQTIVDQFSTWAETLKQMMDDGRFTQFINDMIEKLPQIIEFIGQVGTWVIENSPLIGELIDKVLQLFGIKTENEKIKEAFIEVEGQVKKSAESIGIDVDTMITGIHAYADANDVDLLDIYNNWDYYGPEICRYIQGVATDAKTSGQDLDTALRGMTTSTQTEVEKQITWWDKLVYHLGLVWSGITNLFNADLWENNPSMNDGWDFGSNFGNFGAPHASGGMEYPGRMYRINDDAGHRNEVFIPTVPGYRLNGDQTDHLVNNVNNSRNFSGGINIYVNSYGTDVAQVADELGAAVSQKLRMSGVML